ncbi:hypothetical protein HYW18_00875 [Candidatus Uhrbacteria bacterium]|nr:hypothetical protein [Candidatus Uhrbacteria bacterium]
MTSDLSYLLILAVLWFLFYWVLGGAFFAVMSVFRLGRLKKARFSCLFTLFTAASAFGAAYFGLRWANESSRECISLAQSNLEGFVGFFGCSLVSLTMSFLAGALAVIVLGWLAMGLSSLKILLPGVDEEKE